MTNLQHIILGIVLMLCFGIRTQLGCHEIKEDTKLRLVSTLFRHGDRLVDAGHSESYPNDPHKDYDYYPEGGGQLTIVIHYLGIPEKMIEKKIPGCELLCPYDKFIDLIDNVTATNEELICPE